MVAQQRHRPPIRGDREMRAGQASPTDDLGEASLFPETRSNEIRRKKKQQKTQLFSNHVFLFSTRDRRMSIHKCFFLTKEASQEVLCVEAYAVPLKLVQALARKHFVGSILFIWEKHFQTFSKP